MATAAQTGESEPPPADLVRAAVAVSYTHLVTLLSGFLGAGKTTVLNELLTHAGGLRFAVFENEVGSVNIDSQLISRNQGGIIELTNGCVCCTVNADLVRGLQDLAAQRASGRLSFDWILIETTGLADPGACLLYTSRCV